MKTKCGDLCVCQKAFVSVHGVSIKSLKCLCKFMNEGHTSPPTDQRGKHGKQWSLPEDIKAKIMAHIDSFPAQELHYSWKDNHESLNIKRMWYLYLEKHEPEQMECLQQKLPYRNIFNTCFNIGFGRPRSDACTTCDSFAIQIQAENGEKA